MTRQQVTTLIRTRGGKVHSRDTSHTVYIIPLSETRLHDLRERIPYMTCWHGKFGNGQSLAVFFDQPTDGGNDDSQG